MKKGEIYTGVVEKMDFPNKGVLHIGEEKVVVKNALPGQTVEIAISKQRKGKCEGRLLKVVTPADYEKLKVRVRIAQTAADVHTRPCRMKSS